MTSTLGAGLTERLATSATGWAAVIDGVLNVRTVTETQKSAALNAMAVSGFRVLAVCADPECDCMVKLMDKVMPGRVQLVLVAVQVEAR